MGQIATIRVAALFPVGASDGGCPAAIQEILTREDSLEVHLIYGKQGEPDTADPEDTVERIRECLANVRATLISARPVEPFNLSKAYDDIREFVRHVATQNYDRVYVGITGATNPMVTSLFQTAMAYLLCEVLPVYVQARGVRLVQHFLASDIRDRVVAEEALAIARAGQIRVAAELTKRLRSEEDWRFLGLSLAALALWDDFDYKQAKQSLAHQARKAEERLRHEFLAPIADTVIRLAQEAVKTTALVSKISDTENFAKAATAADWPATVSKFGPLVVADTLANAQRRITEGRNTDSVLRAYRAAECAAQMRLFILGIHPSRIDESQNVVALYPSIKDFSESGTLAFRQALEFLDSIGEIQFSQVSDCVRKLSSTRNYTYLEHGYQRIHNDQALRCLEWSLEICKYLIQGMNTASLPELTRFEMRF